MARAWVVVQTRVGISHARARATTRRKGTKPRRVLPGTRAPRCAYAAAALTCQHHLPGHEDEQHHLGHLHAVDEAREQLGLVLRSAGACSASGRAPGRVWACAAPAWACRPVPAAAVVLRAPPACPRTLEKSWCPNARPSRRMGNLTSQVPTMFCTLNSLNWAGKLSFCTILAYCRGREGAAAWRVARRALHGACARPPARGLQAGRPQAGHAPCGQRCARRPRTWRPCTPSCRTRR